MNTAQLGAAAYDKAADEQPAASLMSTGEDDQNLGYGTRRGMNLAELFQRM
jgi:hypothetical protein